MSRTSGAGPLAVWGQCANTAAPTLTSYPFEEIQYVWNWGDNGTQTWSTGSRPGVALKNVSYGGTAAHLYDNCTGSSSCSYDVTVTASYNGTLYTKDFGPSSVVVTPPDSEWPTTATLCVYATTLGSGCPTGADSYSTSNFDTLMQYGGYACCTGPHAPYHRILFQGGDTFTSASGVSGGNKWTVAGPGYIGSFGTGNATINFTNTTAGQIMFEMAAPCSDWRIVGITFTGSGPSGGYPTGLSNFQCPEATMDLDSFSGFSTSISSEGDEGMLANSTITNGYGNGGTASGYGAYIFADTQYVAALGNSIDGSSNAGSDFHDIRVPMALYGVFSDNTLQEEVGFDEMKIEGQPVSGGTWPQPQYIVVSDNKMISNAASGATNDLEIGDGGSGSQEAIQHIVIERNWWQGAAGYNVLTGGSYVSIRDNVFDTSGGTGSGPVNIRQLSAGTTPPGVTPDYTWVDNNTQYTSDAIPGGSTYLVQLGNNSLDHNVGHVFINNNLVFTPNVTSSPTLIQDMSGGTAIISESNNTSDAGISGSFTTDPKFTCPSGCASVGSFTPTSAKPTTGSYAIGAGTSVPVWSDFFLTAQPSPRDIGAVNH